MKSNNERRYHFHMQVFQINDNIVMTRAKVGTSTCTAIVYNRVKEMYSDLDEFNKSDDWFPRATTNPPIYQRIRDIATYNVFEEDGKLHIRHLSENKGASKHYQKEQQKANQNNMGSPGFWIPRNKLEEKIIEDTVSAFENIVNGKSNKKIYILCREPADHWSTAILEDLKYTLNQETTSEMVGRLKKYFIGTEFEKYHLNVLDDYKNGKPSSILNTFPLNDKWKESKGQHPFELEHLYFYMRDRYVGDKVFNNHKAYIEFKKTYFEALWWMVIDPYKADKGVHNTTPKTILYNMISTHYQPYLTRMWLLFCKVYYPEYIKFVDIKDGLGLIKRTGNIQEMSNTKDKNVKEAWNAAFYSIDREGEGIPHLVYTQPEIAIYETILEYNNR